MKRLLKNICLIIACALVLCIGLALFLMLSPGSSLFGIKYLSYSKTGIASDWQPKEYNDKDQVENIYLVTYGVPVTVKYATTGNFKFTFTQNFTGFTRSKIDVPNMEVVKDDQNNLLVKTDELIPFIYGTNSAGYSLEIAVPVTYQNKIVSIDSTKSNVNVSVPDSAVATFDEFTAKTAGSVSFAGKVNIGKNLNIEKSKKELNIGDNVSFLPSASVSIKTQSHQITTIKNVISNELFFEGKNSGLLFAGAGKLTVANAGKGIYSSTENLATISGDVSITNLNGKIELGQVAGEVAISSKRGNVSIGIKDSAYGVSHKMSITTTSGDVSLFGTNNTDDATITTTNGEVYVSNINVLSVNSKRGKITIDSATKLTTTGETGDIFVGTVTESVSITTKAGHVALASENAGIVNNATIVTKTGNVTVYHAQGTFSATTTKGNVWVDSNGVTETTIKTTSGSVDAKGLCSKTTITSDGEITAKFVKLDGKVEIAGNDKNITVIVPNDEASIQYSIKSEKKKAIVKYTTTTREGKSISNYETITSESKQIVITSDWGVINLLSEENAG